MPISYAERKKRRQAMLQGLAPELRQRLALRHVEAVTKLAPEAQQTLVHALTGGLRSISDAIVYLHQQPQASVEEVLRAGKDGRQGGTATPALRFNPPWSPANIDPDALSELSELLQSCFPGMPSMTAQALAADELLAEVLALVSARQTCFRSKSIQSELVFVALCGLALQFIDQLTRLVTSHPHYRRALAQSKIEERCKHKGHEVFDQGHNGVGSKQL